MPNHTLSLAGLLALLTQTAAAQGSTIFGRVISDSGMPLAGAEVVLNGPQNLQRTNERGEFTFARVPAGFQVIGVRMAGFAPNVDTVEVEDAGEIRREYRLSRIETTLPKVPVTATLLDLKLAEFHERRRLGAGRFLDSAQFANLRGSRTSDRIGKLPAVVILRGRNSAEAFIANQRNRPRNNTGVLDRSNPGIAPVWCKAMIWLDGLKVGTDFNINSLDPSVIAAVEWYASEATVPAKYNVIQRDGSLFNPRFCGVLAIWLR